MGIGSEPSFARRPFFAFTGALFLTVAATAWWIGGWRGLAYLAAFPLLCLPGIPLGVALFGRRHPAGWLAGLLLGYGTTTLAAWAVVFLEVPSATMFAVAWLMATLAALAVARRTRDALCPLPPWTPRASAGLVGVLLLVPLLVAVPFGRLGEVDASGARSYRAYFIADFAWHTALTAELARQEARPRNPYLADEPLHYYWTYFLVPATLAAEGGFEIEPLLKLNALATALLLAAAIYLGAWSAMPAWPLAAAGGVALTIVASSAEGLAALADIMRRGLPWSEVRDLNIDAIAAWGFRGLRVDDLPRTMWYTPQHGFACALALLSVPFASSGGSRSPWPGRAVIGGTLGASLAFSPLIGLAACLVYAVTTLFDAARSRQLMSTALGQWPVVLPVIAAVGWCALVQVGDDAAGVLHVGFWGPARNAPLITFVLQFGPLLPLMAIALWSGAPVSRAALIASIAGTVVAVALMHFIALTVDLYWAGFRGGNVFFIFAPALVGGGLIALHERCSPRAAAFAAALVLAIGLPTTAIDTFNAQDIGNHHLSRDAERERGRNVAFDPAQEFHWTVVVPADDMEALRWIRRHTPAAAVVQAEPIVRGRETWSLIPSLAERRMATGVPVPLLDRSIYRTRNAMVRQIYATTDGEGAWQAARALGIDYLWLDRTEREAYPAGTAKFDEDEHHFVPVFQNGSAAVYAVRP